MGERLLRSFWSLAKAIAVVAALVAGLVWVSRRRGREAPVAEPPVWPPLPEDQAAPAPAPATATTAAADTPAGTVEDALATAASLEEVAAEAGAEVALAPDPVGADARATEEQQNDDAHETLVVWVVPKDGGCPDGYPVKAKLASRIFHVPGGTSYARTIPDRCYATPADAESDGFRPAKR